MISLVIDTCTSNLIIAVCKDEQVINQLIQKNDNNLSTNFTTLIEKLLSDTNILINEIDSVFIANGPGSFTGVRIGVTFAKVFGWAKKIKVIPFSSLELLASSYNNEYIVPLLNARRGYVYAGVYDNNLNNIIPDKYIKLDELLEQIKNYVGVTYVSCDECNISTLEPKYNISKIINKHKNDVSINPHKLVPNYLKKTEAEEKLEVNNVSNY